MFDRFPPAPRTSNRSLFLSVAIHCAAILALFAVKVTVLDKPPLRNTQVLLLTPSKPDSPPPKRVIVRTPPKMATLPKWAKLPTPVLSAPPAIVQPPVIQPPVLKTPPIPERMADITPPPVAPRQPVVQTNVFSIVAKAVVSQPAPAAVQTGGFSGASMAAPQAEKETQIVAAG